MSNVTTSIRHGLFAQFTLPNATPVVQNMDDAPLPCVLTLNSSDAGRLIQISTDGGLSYFTPQYDTSLSAQLAVVINAPISHAQFTGAVAGTDLVVIK